MIAVRRTVMVIDDDPGFLEFMRYLLESGRYQVVLYGQSITAMDEIRRQRPDLVILDLAMPEKTGWAVLDELKADPATAAIPVIICTAAVLETEKKRSLVSALNVRTILKPFDVSDLLALIETALLEHAVDTVVQPGILRQSAALLEHGTGRQPRHEVSHE